MSERGKHPEDADSPETMAQFPVPRPERPYASPTAELTPPPPATSDEMREASLDTPPTRPPSPPPASDRELPSGLNQTFPSTPVSANSGFVAQISLTGKPKPGDVIFDRYRVVSELGEGGMGSVLLVHHNDLDVDRALKLIIAEIAADPQVRARFKREARVMAKLSHPNSVAVYHYQLARDVAFIEMEYVRGQSLNKLLRGHPMPLDWTARILEQLCDVLQAAHDLNIVHRDLKPSNLMLVDGRPPGRELLKVLDFGIAKILSSDGSDPDELRTQTNTFIGTAHYSSPEQMRGSQIDARSDLYSTGVMLYEFLTGQRPFSGSAQMLICDHLTAPPPPFFIKNPHNDVPPEVERVVLRCLAKDADDRPQSARALAEEFLQAVQASSTRPGERGGAIPTRLLHGDYNEPTRRFGSTQIRGETAGKPGSPATGPTRPSDRPGDPNEDAGDPGVQEIAFPTHTPDPRARRRALVVAGAVALAVAAVVALVLIAVRLMSKKEKEPVPENHGTVPVASRTFEPSAEARRKITEWGAAGIVPDVEKGTNSKGWPNGVRHLDPATSHDLTYSLSDSGHYLPDGYRPEGTKLAPDDWPLTLVRDKDKARFVRIPGGTFMMGCLDGTCTGPADPAFPPHKVTLSGYYIQVNEVTDGEVLRYAKDFAGQFKSRKWDEDHRNLRLVLGSDSACGNYPATSLSHKQAEHFAAFYANGKLPTEAQWEFAARSRSEKGNLYPWSWRKPAEVTRINAMPLKERGNINRAGDRQIDTQPVGSYPATDMTEQGVFDMAGNLREWCRDIYDRYAEGEERNPEGPKRAGDGTDGFVFRGGSFSTDTVASVQTTFRDQFSEGGAVADLGFRVVLETPDSPGKTATTGAPGRR